MQITPLQGNVLLKEIKSEAKTQSGIVLPDSIDKDKQTLLGEVVALPIPLEDETPRFEIGQKVIYKKYAPDVIEVEGEEFLMIDEDSILATVN